ncbi:Kinesin-like protein Klp98A, partial [Eumeta japonica]
VFEKLGRAVLAAVEGGVPACVLAYGQSATGKTHTMMGADLQPGLVPRLCAALAAKYRELTIRFQSVACLRPPTVRCSPRRPPSAAHVIRLA